MEIALLTPQVDCKSVKTLKSSFNRISVYDNHENITADADIVFVLNYDKIISKHFFNLYKFGMVVIHSSDLPKGRGWAPIFNSINNADEEYVMTAFKIDEKVDRGNIIMKLRIKKPKIITNNNLRDIDEDGTVLLIKRIIELISHSNDEFLLGIPQNEENTIYNKRRTKKDNLINPNETIKNSLLHILATNEDYPTYIILDGEKIYISAMTDKYYSLNEMDYVFEINER